MHQVDFALKNQYGEVVSPIDLPGKWILLSFHPLAWTSVCAQQMKDLDGVYEQLTARGVQPLGISVDAVPCKKAWADHLQLENLPILSDFWPHGELAENVDVFMPSRGTSGRANVLLNVDREVVFTRNYEMSQVPDVKELLEMIDREL